MFWNVLSIPCHHKEYLWMLNGQAPWAQSRSLSTTNQGPEGLVAQPPFGASRNPESSRKLQQPFGPFIKTFQSLDPKITCNFAVKIKIRAFCCFKMAMGILLLCWICKLVACTGWNPYWFLKKSLLDLHWSIASLLQLSQNWRRWSTV